MRTPYLPGRCGFRFRSCGESRRDRRDACFRHVLGRSLRQAAGSLRSQMVHRHAHRRFIRGRNEAGHGRSDGQDAEECLRLDDKQRSRGGAADPAAPPGQARKVKIERKRPTPPPGYQTASKILRSRRLFPVGPVSIASPSALKNGYASNFSSAARASSPRACARDSVEPSAIAPAEGLLPSMPSVPALSTVIFSPAIFSAQASANCWLRPPTPPSVTFTVTSPPEIKHTRSDSVLSARTRFTRYSSARS